MLFLDIDRAISVTIDKEIVHRVSITPHNQNLTAVEGESIRFSINGFSST